ncbi:MAG: sulfatase-like hydrolase/transferase [Verrucomicrobia bacterium]|nr:sulfatase-like hydrolase/transferase [Verrucomicrobiota bacterium]
MILIPTPQNLQSPITDGPTTRGFDYFFGISASLDMPPFAFIENNHYTEAPTAVKSWVRKGPAAPSFEAVDALPTLTQKSIAFIDGRSKIKNAPPFFLYVPLTSPHTPILPSPQWQGKSPLGPYGDFVMQTDDAVGQILAALDKADLRKNTLVIFTSDNGCSPAAGTARLEKLGHFPSGEFRGYKADIWDGGHRVPFIVRWPNVVTPGSSSSLAICHTDLLATCADISGVPLPETAGEDSFSFLPILLGREPKIPRAPVMETRPLLGKWRVVERSWGAVASAL